MILRACLVILAVLFSATTHAQIYRWDNGQVISGTEGITLGPGVDLAYRQLEFAQMAGEDLTNAVLVGSTLTNANLTGAVVTGAQFNITTPGGFTAAQLYSTQSYKAKNLSGIGFTQNDFTGWDFSGQNLTNADIRGSILTSVNMTGAVILGTWLAQATQYGFTKEQLYSTASYEQKDLQRINLQGSDLSGWDFSGQNLSNASFASVLFVGSVTLRRANLAQANLNSTGFFGADLAEADLRGAVVQGTDFGRTNLTKEQLYSTTSYQQKNLMRIGLSADNFIGWDFSGQNLANADFSGSDLTSADLTNANLVNVLMRGAKLTSTLLSRADLRGSIGLSDISLNGIISDTAIQSNGSVFRLTLANGEKLVVRDDDGVAESEAMPWLPTRPPFSVSVYGSFESSTAGVLELVFETDTWDSLISFEPGIPVQLGGTLELTFTDDTQLATQSGRTIKVFDWTGVTPQGQFTVHGQPGTAWDTSKLYTTGEVTLLGISSDLNRDKDVDSEDLTAFLANWTGSEYLAADKTWQTGDSDEDGDVDSADMLVFLSQWTGTPAASRVVSVPEPAGAIQVLAALVALLLSILRCREVKQ